MAEKEVWEKRYYSLRTLFGARSLFKSFFRRFDNKIFGKTAGNIKLSSSGFTLIEIVIVIALFSIFLVGAIVILDPTAQLHKANDARRKSDLSQIQKALEVYYDDFAKYPPSSSDYRIQYPDGTSLTWGTSLFGNYMVKLPKDPKSGRNYIYYSTGQSYFLYASLERGNKDSNVCKSDGTRCNNVPAGVFCGGTSVCNFGVSSPNVSP